MERYSIEMVVFGLALIGLICVLTVPAFIVWGVYEVVRNRKEHKKKMMYFEMLADLHPLAVEGVDINNSLTEIKSQAGYDPDNPSEEVQKLEIRLEEIKNELKERHHDILVSLDLLTD